METYEVVFKKVKETKNMVRFEEVPEKGKQPVIGTLYVQKWAVGDVTVVAVKLVGK